MSATGAFTSSMTGLTPGVLYHVRAYATNAAGTAYGDDVTFTTLLLAPTVTTQPVTGITQTTATGNGTITVLGVPNPTQHGVVWSTVAQPHHRRQQDRGRPGQRHGRLYQQPHRPGHGDAVPRARLCDQCGRYGVWG